MFDTNNKKSMNNEIAYVGPKNKTRTHIMSLKNKISDVVGICIFRSKNNDGLF